MNTHFFDRYSQHITKVVYFFLWLTGITLGVIAAVNHQSVSAAILKGVFSKSPSAISCVLLIAVRILIFYFALCYGKSLIVYSILFIDAFCFGFCGIAIYMAVGESAWLIRPLILFSRIWSYIPVWWLLLCGTPRSKMSLLFVAGFVCLVVLFDLTFIAPILFDSAKYL